MKAVLLRRRTNPRNLSGYASLVENTFFHRLVHTFFLSEANRLSASDPVKDLGSRSPFRPPNSQKTAIKYDKLGCHACGCSWALLGCFWASPGLLGLSEGSRAAPSCLWAAPVAGSLEPRKIMKMTSLMTNLADQIKATANFLGLGEGLAS